MREAMARATARILERTGEASLLRGSIPCKVNFADGTEVTGVYDDMVALRTVATLSNSVSPATGDRLVRERDGAAFKLDALLRDNGFSSVYVVLPR